MVPSNAARTTRKGINGLGRLERAPRLVQQEQAAPSAGLGRRLRRFAIGLVLLATVGAIAWMLLSRYVAYAIVEGQIVTLTAPAPVVVEQVHVRAGAWCDKGDPLVTLRAHGVEQQRAVLEAQVEQARLRLSLVRNGAETDEIQLTRRSDLRDQAHAELKSAAAAVESAQVAYEHALWEWQIFQSLLENGQANKREADVARVEAAEAQAELQRAQASLESAQARYERAAALVPQDAGGERLRELEIALLSSRLSEAQQRLREFDEQTGTRTITAPCAGRVDRVFVESTAFVPADGPLVTLYDPNSLYPIVFASPDDADRLEIGDVVRMYSQWNTEPIEGAVRAVHAVRAPVPEVLRARMGGSANAVTVQVDCDPAGRTRLRPNMILRVVGGHW